MTFSSRAVIPGGGNGNRPAEEDLASFCVAGLTDATLGSS